MNKGLLSLFLPVFFFSFSGHVSAAMLYMDPNSAEVKRGDTVSIAVRIDTDEEECINVIDSVITYSSNLEPVDTSRGNSIFSIWVEEPVIDKVNRTITFAGGIPNGYCGRIAGDPRLTNTVVELIFRSPAMMIGGVDDGDLATVDFDTQTRVLLNDGYGTDAPLNMYGAQISLSDKVGSQANEWSDKVNTDTTPPQQFSIALERTPNAFSNDYYIVFNTTDKQSGIDHYEVIEESFEDQNFFAWGAETAPWVTAKSPYVLDDQSLNSTIRVRAIDKAGNEYVATLVPDESKRTISAQAKVMFAILGAGVLVLLTLGAFSLFMILRRFRKGGDEDLEVNDIDN